MQIAIYFCFVVSILLFGDLFSVDSVLFCFSYAFICSKTCLYLCTLSLSFIYINFRIFSYLSKVLTRKQGHVPVMIYNFS